MEQSSNKGPENGIPKVVDIRPLIKGRDDTFLLANGPDEKIMIWTGNKNLPPGTLVLFNEADKKASKSGTSYLVTGTPLTDRLVVEYSHDAKKGTSVYYEHKANQKNWELFRTTTPSIPRAWYEYITKGTYFGGREQTFSVIKKGFESLAETVFLSKMDILPKDEREKILFSFGDEGDTLMKEIYKQRTSHPQALNISCPDKNGIYEKWNELEKKPELSDFLDEDKVKELYPEKIEFPGVGELHVEYRGDQMYKNDHFAFIDCDEETLLEMTKLPQLPTGATGFNLYGTVVKTDEGLKEIQDRRRNIWKNNEFSRIQKEGLLNTVWEPIKVDSQGDVDKIFDQLPTKVIKHDGVFGDLIVMPEKIIVTPNGVSLEGEQKSWDSPTVKNIQDAWNTVHTLWRARFGEYEQISESDKNKIGDDKIKIEGDAVYYFDLEQGILYNPFGNRSGAQKMKDAERSFYTLDKIELALIRAGKTDGIFYGKKYTDLVELARQKIRNST
jgi:hypothetical protein